MITVKNNSRVTLGLPGGAYLQSGQSIGVDAGALDSRAVKAWVDKGILSVEDDEKDRLIAALAERGIKRDRRHGAETLRALLDESAG